MVGLTHTLGVSEHADAEVLRTEGVASKNVVSNLEQQIGMPVSKGVLSF